MGILFFLEKQEAARINTKKKRPNNNNSNKMWSSDLRFQKRNSSHTPPQNQTRIRQVTHTSAHFRTIPQIWSDATNSTNRSHAHQKSCQSIDNTTPDLEKPTLQRQRARQSWIIYLCCIHIHSWRPSQTHDQFLAKPTMETYHILQPNAATEMLWQSVSGAKKGHHCW